MNAQAKTVRAAMDAGNYKEGARAALESMGARLTCKLSDTKSPQWEADHGHKYHPHWRCRIARGHRSHTFDFYDSVNAGENGAPEPSAYSVLACLQWTDPGTFEDFCGEFGYDTDSRGAERTWNACVAQYKALCRVFTDEQREALSEIR